MNSDGQIVVALTTPRPEDELDQSGNEVSEDDASHIRPELVTCANVACTNPRRQTIDRDLYATGLDARQRWDLTLTPDGRPVLMGFDLHTRDRIVAITCEKKECHRPNVETTPAPNASNYGPDIEVTVGADGRPVAINYPVDSASHIIGCHDPRCAKTTVRRLPDAQKPIGIDSGPADTPEIAMLDTDRDLITISTCHGIGCDSRRPVARFTGNRGGPFFRMDNAFASDQTGRLLVRDRYEAVPGHSKPPYEWQRRYYDVTTFPTDP